MHYNLNFNKNKKSLVKTLLSLILFILGLGIFSYPLISRYYYKIEATKVVTDFKEGKKIINNTEIDRRMSLAKAYNAVLNGDVNFTDPYINNVEEGIANYANMLKIREKIGIITIPKLSLKLPIYAGTSEEVLQHGIGHMEYTSLPIGGQSTHSVLTGHRGLPNDKLFSELNFMKIGDLFFIENLKETLAYKVISIKTIEPNDFDDLVIEKDKDFCTLLTCTPYMINSHRLIVTGERTEYSDKQIKIQISNGKVFMLIKYLIITIVILLILILILINKKRRKRGRVKNNEKI